MRILVSLCTLSLIACSCSQPSPATFQQDLRGIRDAYEAAAKYEPLYCIGRQCDGVRIAHYNAAAALTIAAGDPSAQSVREARQRVQEFIAAEGVR